VILHIVQSCDGTERGRFYGRGTGGLTRRLPETSERPKSGIAQTIFFFEDEPKEI
jgi:hypothetical protein